MALEVRFNKADHMHENRQFRRIAKLLTQQFQKEGWNGLLLGNVECAAYERFRADGILYFDSGIIIFDLKDYNGRLEIPRESEFGDCMWFNTNSKGERINVKGGNRFINPFKQLSSYRGVFKNLIQENALLKNKLNSKFVGALNIFSGPIELNREVGGSYNRYYNIVDENRLCNYLFDYTSKNGFNNEAAETLKQLFPSDEFVLDNQPIEENEVVEEPKIIDGKIKGQVEEFIQSDNQVLILTSSSFEERDNWAHLIPDIATDNGAPQSDVWIHSARLKSRVEERSGVESYSIYGSIFGGNKETEEEGTIEEVNQETVPVKSDVDFSEKDVFVIHEAHLVTKGFFQSTFLKFGTGRLLEDLLSFLKLADTKRKLICIGDPYSISYGKVEESALQEENYEDLKVISMHSDTIREYPHLDTVKDLTYSIDEGFYRNLNYPRSNQLADVDGAEIATLLKKWFATPFTSPPKQSYLLYSRAKRLEYSKWIKKNCLNNGADVNTGDLLIAQNNIRIDDPESKLRKASISNGEYLTVKSVIDLRTESINVKANEPPVLLNFVKVEVERLNSPKETLVIYVLNNFIESAEALSDTEELALKILQNKIIKELRDKSPFEKSTHFTHFEASQEKNILEKEIIDFQTQLNSGEKVKGKLEQKEVALRKLKRAYKRKYTASILEQANKHPLVNTLLTTYGWAITVNRSLGSLFDEIILDCERGDNKGQNESYYRWIYSAFQSVDKSIYLRNVIEFSPTDELKEYDFTNRKDNISEVFEESKVKEQKLLELVIPDDFKDSLDLHDKTKNTQFGAALIYEFLIENCEATVVSSEGYKVKFYCEASSKQFSILMYHKKSGLISSLVPENLPENKVDLLEEIHALLNKNRIAKKEKNETKEVIVDGFRKLMYSNWQEKLLLAEVNLEVIETNIPGWYDILKFKTLSNEAVLKLVYKKAGYFSKNPQVLYCSDDSLLDQLQKEIF